MQRGLYSAATGMAVSDRWMEVISQNLANVSTAAYKRDLMVFNEGLERQMYADGGQGSRLGAMGSGPQTKAIYTVWEQGTVQATGRPYDMALATNEGMFAVQTPQGVAYTRDGSFRRSVDGNLVDKLGNAVLDTQGRQITLSEGDIKVSMTGEVTVGERSVAQIAVFTGQFAKAGDNLYASTDASLMDDGQFEVRQGCLESSNVNAIEEMVAMIRLNRGFELAQKSVQSQDESTSRLIQSLSER